MSGYYYYYYYYYYYRLTVILVRCNQCRIYIEAKGGPPPLSPPPLWRRHCMGRLGPHVVSQLIGASQDLNPALVVTL